MEKMTVYTPRTGVSGGTSPADTLVFALEHFFWISDLQSCKSLEREVLVQTFTQLNSCRASIPSGVPRPHPFPFCTLLPPGSSLLGWHEAVQMLRGKQKECEVRGTLPIYTNQTRRQFKRRHPLLWWARRRAVHVCAAVPVGRTLEWVFLAVCTNGLDGVCVFSFYYLISQFYPKGIIQRKKEKKKKHSFVKMSIKPWFFFFLLWIIENFKHPGK